MVCCGAWTLYGVQEGVSCICGICQAPCGNGLAVCWGAGCGAGAAGCGAAWGCTAGWGATCGAGCGVVCGICHGPCGNALAVCCGAGCGAGAAGCGNSRLTAFQGSGMGASGFFGCSGSAFAGEAARKNPSLASFFMTETAESVRDSMLGQRISISSGFLGLGKSYVFHDIASSSLRLISSGTLLPHMGQYSRPESNSYPQTLHFIKLSSRFENIPH